MRVRYLLAYTALVAAVAASLVLWVPTPAHAGKRTEQFHWSGALSPGHTVTVNNVNGSVTVERSAGSQVTVDATKTGRRSDPSEVRIEVLEDGGNVTICALYPGAGNHCNDDGTLTSNLHRNDVSIAFTIHVPDGARIRARTVNGGVEMNARSEDVEVKTVNGSIRFATMGRGVAHTVNGGIDATVAHLTNDIELHTVNGGVSLELPRDADADLSLGTTNGRIDVDAPITTQGRLSRHHIDGRMGAGGHGVECKTVNGGIRIRSGGV